MSELPHLCLFAALVMAPFLLGVLCLPQAVLCGTTARLEEKGMWGERTERQLGEATLHTVTQFDLA